MIISVVIVSYNTSSLTLDCLKSLIEASCIHTLDIIVVDNASVDGTLEAIRVQFSDVTLVANTENVGFSTANNMGIKIAKGSKVLLLNSDTLVKDGAIDELVRFSQSMVGIQAVAPKLLNFDNSYQKSHFNFPSLAKATIHLLGLTATVKLLLEKVPYNISEDTTGFDVPTVVDYVIFAAVMIDRDVFDKVGLLDESMFFYHEDCEFGLRMKSFGIQQWYVPDAIILHLGGASSSKVSLQSYGSYFRGMHYVFEKHYRKPIFFTFTAIWKIAFSLKYIASLFGYTGKLGTPSTYANSSSAKHASVPRGLIQNTYRDLLKYKRGQNESS